MARVSWPPTRVSALLVALVLAIFTLWARGADGGESQYRLTGTFERVKTTRVMDEEFHFAVVQLTADWQGGYPGMHMCNLSLLDSAGTAIAELPFDLMSLTSAASLELDVPLDSKDDASRIAHVTGACDGARLDDSQGRYVLSNVRIIPAPENTDDLRTFELSFDIEWTGHGRPGSATCVASIYGADRASLFTYEFTLSDEQAPSSGRSMRVIAQKDIEFPPSDAEVTCNPF